MGEGGEGEGGDSGVVKGGAKEGFSSVGQIDG